MTSSTGSSYEHSNHNSTITTSVSIRVTPVDDYLVSWGILWCGFWLITIFACYQVYKDYNTSKNSDTDIENGGGSGAGAGAGEEGASTADITRSLVCLWKKLKN